MPRPLVSLLALALGTALVLGLSSCGEEDAQLLPGETAREITANLDAVKQLADEGDCVGAEAASGQVSEQVEALDGVDRRLKQALEQGTERLNEVIAGCEEEETEAIAPAVIPEDEEEPEDERGDGDEDRDENGGGKGDGEGGGRDEAPGQQKEPGTEPTPTPEPPAKPEGKGPGKDESTTPSESPAEGPSGGIEPSSPVEEGDEG